eukprot:6029655-Ditylum_brightwellii.AAC.1
MTKADMRKRNNPWDASANNITTTTALTPVMMAASPCRKRKVAMAPHHCKVDKKRRNEESAS